MLILKKKKRKENKGKVKKKKKKKKIVDCNVPGQESNPGHWIQKRES